MLYAVICNITMLCKCRKPYNDNNNALSMSNNQCSVVVATAYMFYLTQPVQHFSSYIPNGSQK